MSPYIPAGHDTFGEVLREAHARGIRIIGRFDFSKANKDAFDAHPEWFFRRADGEPAIYNGLYQACINGGWYREKAVEILSEALDRYDVDGLFFNMFSNPAADYGGHPLGICHCDNCKRLYQQRYHRALPDKPDADYRAFLHGATIPRMAASSMRSNTSAGLRSGAARSNRTLWSRSPRRFLAYMPYAGSCPHSKYSPPDSWGTSRIAASPAVPPPAYVISMSLRLIFSIHWPSMLVKLIQVLDSPG